MSKQTKQLREAISLVLRAQSEELKEGAGSKAKASELNEKIDSILNRVFMERSREIIQKLNETELADDESRIGTEETEETEGYGAILLNELEGLQLDEIDDIEDAADDDGDLVDGGDEPSLDDDDADAAVDAEDDDMDFDDIDFGADDEGDIDFDADEEGDIDFDAAGDDELPPSDDGEEIEDEEIA